MRVFFGLVDGGNLDDELRVLSVNGLEGKGVGDAFHALGLLATTGTLHTVGLEPTMVDLEGRDPEATAKNGSDDGSQRDPRESRVIVTSLRVVSTLKEDSKRSKVVGVSTELASVGGLEAFVDALPLRRVLGLIEIGQAGLVLLVGVGHLQTQLDLLSIEVGDDVSIGVVEGDVHDGREDVACLYSVGDCGLLDRHRSVSLDDCVGEADRSYI
mmetsp:Transcript_11236/g.18992  ORF Transcript_11236/g.18992 Transcript_11236/m.18992 type:complete len:213 (+) Transcript_11236:166-804(+)